MKFKIVLLVLDPQDTFTLLPEGLPKLLAGVQSLKGDFELVIVHNTPVEEAPRTAAYLLAYERTHSNAYFRQQERNRGISFGLNVGAKCGDKSYDILVMMSGDALIVDADMLVSLESLFQDYPKIGCLHPVSLFEDSPTLCNYSKDYTFEQFHEHLRQGPEHCRRVEAAIDGQIKEMLRNVKRAKRRIVYPLPTMPLTFLAIRAELFNAMCGFDEAFCCGHENNDFVLRALRKGYRSGVANQLFIYHRRLLFRRLGQAGPNQALYRELAVESAKAWRRKYGQDGGMLEMFYEAQYGKCFARFLLPFAVTSYKSLKRLRFFQGRNP